MGRTVSRSAYTFCEAVCGPPSMAQPRVHRLTHTHVHATLNPERRIAPYTPPFFVFPSLLLSNTCYFSWVQVQ